MQSKPRQGEGEEEVEERHRLKRPVPKGRTFRPLSGVIPYISRAKPEPGGYLFHLASGFFVARPRFLVRAQIPHQL